MKILQVITTLGTGGAEKIVCQLAMRLKEAGHECDVAVFRGGDTQFRRLLDRAGVRVIEFSPGGSVYSPRHILRLRRLMRGYDIVHTHNTSPQLFAALARRRRGAKLVTTEHNTSNRRRAWRWYKPVDRWMYSRYAHVACIAATAEQNLRDFIGRSRAGISTIENGVDLEAIRAAAPLPDFKPEGAVAITMVAGLRPQKDQDTLIRALGSLPERFHLFLVGDGERRALLEALAAEQGVTGRVHFTGVRSDVPRVLKSSDYLVMSSHYEGLSLSSVEGMAAGRPMLASDVPGLREVVGGAGILFPHSDAAAFASQILALDADPSLYAATAEACARRAARYDLRRMTDSYLDLYRSLTLSV